MAFDTRHKSRVLLDGPDRAGARALFRSVGFTEADLQKPLIGVSHCWIELSPCNHNHRRLAAKVKEGIREAGGTPIEFNTISVNDGIAQECEGMKASLVSREEIADSIELVCRGHLFDGLVAIAGCDKTIPAAGMALLRLNVPGLVLYSGSAMPGSHAGRHLTIQDVFEAVGSYNSRRISAAELHEIASATLVRVRARAGGNLRPIRWRRVLSCSESPPWVSMVSPLRLQRKRKSPLNPAG